MAKKTNTYNPTIDALRVISILAVVLIHSTTKIIGATHLDALNITSTLFINQSLRFAVPMFFVVSGFVLQLNFHKHENFIAYFKKRINRILIPYLFWSLIYYFLIFRGNDGSLLSNLLTGSASYQLYFLPAIFIFYFIFPFLHLFYKKFTSNLILIVLAVIEMILLYYEYFVAPLPFSYPISVTILNYFFFIFGIYLANNQVKIKNLVKTWKYILLLIAIFFSFYVFWEGRSLYESTKNYLFVYTQWRPSIFIYSLLVIILLYYFVDKLRLNIDIVKKLSSLSFFVFFIHVWILEILWDHLLVRYVALPEVNNPNQIYLNIFYFGLTIILSFGAAFVVHKIPKLAKITG